MPIPLIVVAPWIICAGAAVSRRFSFGQAVTSEVCSCAAGGVGEGGAMHVDRALQLQQGAALVDPAVQRLAAPVRHAGLVGGSWNVGELRYSDSSPSRRSRCGDCRLKLGWPSALYSTTAGRWSGCSPSAAGRRNRWLFGAGPSHHSSSWLDAGRQRDQRRWRPPDLRSRSHSRRLIASAPARRRSCPAPAGSGRRLRARRPAPPRPRGLPVGLLGDPRMRVGDGDRQPGHAASAPGRAGRRR